MNITKISQTFSIFWLYVYLLYHATELVQVMGVAGHWIVTVGRLPHSVSDLEVTQMNTQEV